MLSPDPNMTDDERWPLLNDAGRRMLKRLTEHRHAPRFNFRSGDRLTAEGLERARAFACELAAERRESPAHELPSWLPPFVERCLRGVPFYRRRGGSADDFLSVPTTTRADLARQPWSFVPDAQPLDGLITYPTSGTTGQPMLVPSHPVVSSMYLAVLRRALADRGVTLEGGHDRVAIALVCAQLTTLTYASVSTYLDQAGFVKINLNPDDWNDPADRARYLDDCDAEVVSGDPLSLLALTELPLRNKPKALVSGALSLMPGLRRRLESHFSCPVVDLYAMNEHRPVAGSADGMAYNILGHDLHVEILDPDGRPCPPGARGEVTLTGGRNPFLPLLRYRTGDFASLDRHAPTPSLRDFEGRAPVLLLTADGRRINTIDVTTVLRPFALAQFRLHQGADLSVTLKVRGVGLDFEDLGDALHTVFPAEQRVTVQELTEADVTAGGKVLQYTSDAAGAVAGADTSRFAAAGAREMVRWTTSVARA